MPVVVVEVLGDFDVSVRNILNNRQIRAMMPATINCDLILPVSLRMGSRDGSAFAES